MHLLWFFTLIVVVELSKIYLEKNKSWNLVFNYIFFWFSKSLFWSFAQKIWLFLLRSSPFSLFPLYSSLTLPFLLKLKYTLSHTLSHNLSLIFLIKSQTLICLPGCLKILFKKMIKKLGLIKQENEEVS